VVLTVVLAVVPAVLLVACGSDGGAKGSTTTSTARASTTTTTAPALPGSSLPLFPFATPAEVREWQASYRADGTAPWHLDEGETALAFARFLGYPEVDRVVTQRTDDTGAHVTVGGLVPDTEQTTSAAVVHLVRFGNGEDAPWEVVGTEPTDLSIDVPAYGAVATSPLTVGGRITGVDESITVRVHQLGASGRLGEQCCLPAGGEGAPWSTTVTFSAPSAPVLIVSASTGGHVLQVERFAVTGVRSGGGPAR
jgi:hypothetical protein